MRKHIFFYPAAPVRDFAGSCISDAEGEDMPHRERFLAAFGGPGVWTIRNLIFINISWENRILCLKIMERRMTIHRNLLRNQRKVI